MEKRELVCIVCPVGCSLYAEQGPDVDGTPALTVSGNRCPRGVVYAQEEIRSPKRVVTATCAIDGAKPRDERSLYAPRRIPVKTNIPCPKEDIPALLADIYKTQISLPVKTGDTVITNWKNRGIDVIVTRDIA